MKMPCEIVIWYILPAIRRELTQSMVREFGLSQRETASLLKLTDAAVSQYLSDKRAKLEINDPVILEEISTVAERIVNGKSLTIADLCKICMKLRKTVDLSNDFDVLLEPCSLDEQEVVN